MKARIYLRVAKRPHGQWVNGSQYKVDANHRRQDAPLAVGDTTLRTLHFAIDVELADEAFREPAMPVIGVRLDQDGGFVLEPIVEQAHEEPPEIAPPGAAA